MNEAIAVWVVGSGDASRRDQTAEDFKRHAIIAIGPARSLDDIVAEVESKEARAGRKLRSREPGMIRRFSCEREGDVQVGDIVILRGGLREIVGVGVLGPYIFDKGRGIAAWDLGHVRSTTWIDLSSDDREHLEDILRKSFVQSRFSRLSDGQEPLRRAVKDLVRNKGARPPTDKPEITPDLGLEEFVELVRERCSDPARVDLERLTQAMEVAESFGLGENDYDRLEADTVAMVVIPLLGALGTDLRRMRVEVPIRILGADPAGTAYRVDAVVFSKTGIVDPLLLVEVKRRWVGLGPARRQMNGYMGVIGRPRMANLITDGSEFVMQHIKGLSRGETQMEVSLRFRTSEGATSLAKLSDHLNGR